MKSHTFRALRYPNFRIYFYTQCASQIGSWIQTVAIGWLVYRLTHSAFMLGVVGFASQIPNFFISPFAGVLADRWNRRVIILITQILSMLQAAALAWLFFTQEILVWHILALSFLLGIFNAFDFTCRQSFFIEIVERKQMLGNAIALNSLIANLARMIGPAVAGFIIGLWGEGICFVLNGVSYIPVIAGLLRMRIKRRRKRKPAFIVKELTEGFRYVSHFAPVRALLILLAQTSMIGMSFAVFMPVFAKLLQGGPETLGLLMGAIGLGSMAANLSLASHKKIIRFGSMLPLSALVFAGWLILFALTPDRWYAASCLALAGFGFVVHMTTCNVVIQHIVEDEMRGRVMSFFTMAYMGTAPVGSLLSGALAGLIGAPNMLIAGGAFCVLVSVNFLFKIRRLRRKLRPA